MKVHSCLIILLGIVTYSHSYSKYGRTCKDIGCRSSELCVMETDPCSYRQRQGECGSYPTCKKNSGAKASCSTYVCPPTKVCKMDGETPKCVDDHSKSGHVGYNTQASGPAQTQGSATQNHGSAAQGAGGGQLYPNLPPQQNNYNRQQPPYNGGAQYPGGYPQNGYPQNNYPYNNQGQGGYQQYPNNYPGYQQGHGGYQQPPYQGGYPQYPQNNQYGGQNPSGQKNSGSSFLSDTLTDSLKSIGTDLLKNAFSKLLKNGLNGNNGGATTG